MTGLSPQGIAEHYRRSDATFGEPMSFRELAEIAHFHLFTMPVVFMILIHVMYLTSASTSSRSSFIHRGLRNYFNIIPSHQRRHR